VPFRHDTYEEDNNSA
jgi:hypothetical protein